MTTIRMRLRGARGVLAFALLFFFPALAQAQLFPHLPIKRKRTDCDQEAPIYGTYRRQYYGYFPTCWRRFPPGWGCPSAEAPNWEAEQRVEPIRMPRDLEAPLPGPSDAGAPAGNADSVEPPPDTAPSPFEMPAPGAEQPGTKPSGGAAPATEPGTPTASPAAPPPLVRPTAARTGERRPLVLSLNDEPARRRR